MKALKYLTLFILLIVIMISCLFYLNVNKTDRALNQQEIIELKSVFGKKVDYSKIVINTANLPPTMAAIVLGKHIVFREEYYVEDFSNNYLKMARLVHEVGHIWANQTQGFQSSLIAASEHFRYGQQVYAHEALSKKQSLSGFRYEQQCRILSDYYIKRHLDFDISAYQRLLNKTFLND